MKIGIVSDSHGSTAALAAAIDLLRMRRMQALFHCGDVGGEECLRQLAMVPVPVHFVWGNVDIFDAYLEQYAVGLGLSAPTSPLRVELAGRRIAVCHGHEREFPRLLADGDLDYLFHGHTHDRRDERVGRTRVINPGALYRASTLSCALLDLATDELEFVEVPKKSDGRE